MARIAAKTPVKPGDKLAFAVHVEDMQFFDTQTGLAIRTYQRVPGSYLNAGGSGRAPHLEPGRDLRGGQ